MLKLGVIADTHIPDRARKMPARIFKLFAQEEVDAILHAGDICTRRVLQQLGEVAQVYAVRGNRDWFIPELKMSVKLQFEEVTIGMTHGHGSGWGYVLDKLHLLVHGPHKFDHVEKKVQRILADCDVMVFGHSHVPVNRWQEGRLLFNPGSACCPNVFVRNATRTAGLITVDGSQVQGEIVDITDG